MFVILQLAISVSYSLRNSIGGGLCHGSVISNAQESSTKNANKHLLMESIPKLNRRRDIQKIDRMTSDYVHEVTFVIRQRNMLRLTSILLDVSDPASANYGHHMTKEEVAALTSNLEARDAVMSHLTASSASFVTETLHGEYITASAPISVWERMFNTQFFMFHQSQDSRTFREVVRAESYSIPIGLQPYVDGVFNTIQIPHHSRGTLRTLSRVKENTGDITLTGSATTFMTPTTLRKFYNVGDAQGSSKSTQAIFASINQHFSPSDLATFQAEYGLPLLKVANVVGNFSSDGVCKNNANTCDEGNLDIQYIIASSPISPTTFWYTDDTWSAWLKSVANTPKPPLVFSISYGQEESSVSDAEKDAFNTEAIKLGVMGVTIVAATGDDGAVGTDTRHHGFSSCAYTAIFPASNPYVTAVGATSGPESGTAEVVCESGSNMITSGGGFSEYYDQPSFQTAAVDGYRATVKGTTKDPYAGYDASKRGYPDVSLAGANYHVYIGGTEYGLYGTSASAPVVAGFFSNINAVRLAAGKGSLGWVNPLLYTDSSAFVNDITSGSNNCGGLNKTNQPTCCQHGFSAVPGWDPTTGLGSLDYKKFEMYQNRPPTSAPTSIPTRAPTDAPTQVTSTPTSQAPSPSPTLNPSRTPSKTPLVPAAPFQIKSRPPSQSPTLITSKPSLRTPTQTPFQPVFQVPSQAISLAPSLAPFQATPTAQSRVPSRFPSQAPSPVIDETLSEPPNQITNETPSLSPNEVVSSLPSQDQSLPPFQPPTQTPPQSSLDTRLQSTGAPTAAVIKTAVKSDSFRNTVGWVALTTAAIVYAASSMFYV